LKNKLRRIKTQNTTTFREIYIWNYTIICELSTEKCFCSFGMEIIEYNRRIKWILNKESVNISYFSSLTFPTKTHFLFIIFLSNSKNIVMFFLCEFCNIILQYFLAVFFKVWKWCLKTTKWMLFWNWNPRTF
jgi:hypothetical protein